VTSPDENRKTPSLGDDLIGLVGRVLPPQLSRRLSRWLDRTFPEREVHLRSEGAVKFYIFSPHLQFSLVSGMVAVTAWIGAATAGLVFGDDTIQARDVQIARLHEQERKLRDNIQHLEQDLLTRTESLEQRQHFVEGLLEAVIPTEIAPVTAKGPDAIASDEQERDASRSVGGPVEAMPADTGKTPDKGADKTDKQDELSNLEKRQDQALQKIAFYMDHSTQRLTHAIDTTGLDSSALIGNFAVRRDQYSAPFLLHPVNHHNAVPANWQADQLINNGLELEVLRHTVNNLPLSAPVLTENYISSGYGGRRDPFKKTWAFHAGLDIAGHWKAPIYATAAGTVTFVGRKGAYGRMIEIDHGNGFVTRYGHLAKILVKKGQVISLSETVGLMGNSGRSTGTHLHYEIRYQGKSLNPAKFLKAAQHVQTI